MADIPDLVLRAAGRLAKTNKAPPEVPASNVLPRNGFVPPPANPAVSERSSSPANFAPPAQSISLNPAMLAANGIMLPSAGFSRRVEEFRSIKRQVLSLVQQGATATGGNLNRLVLVTSAIPEEGKTYISINLALALAYERDVEVLLIDADAHRQSMAATLGLSAKRGWLDVVADDAVTLADVSFSTNIPNLTLVPAGEVRPEIPELMSSRKMANFVAGLQQHPNRLVIFDSLPCLVSTEPSILASMVGQALFVVAAGQTSKDEIEASLRLIQSCPNLSLILNKGDPLLMDHFGKYGYGYGYQGNS